MLSLPNKTARVLLSSLAVISITVGSTSGCSKSTPKSNGTELKILDGVLPDIAKQIPLASEFSQLLGASSLLASVKGAEKFTLFVPSNTAIDAYLKASETTLKALLADTAAVDAFVGAHITKGQVSATSLLNKTGESLPMVGGGSLAIGKSKTGQVTLTPSGKKAGTLIAIDVEATNGLVHLVNQVLS